MSRQRQLTVRRFARLTDRAPSFNPFNVTRSIFIQLRVAPDHREGWVCCAARYTLALWSKIAVSVPAWREAGVVNRIPLCSCSWLYQWINVATPSRAASRLAKGLIGYRGQYFNVLNSDSENGLSLLTDGRLNEGMTPSRCMVASMVAPFIAPPVVRMHGHLMRLDALLTANPVE